MIRAPQTRIQGFLPSMLIRLNDWELPCVVALSEGIPGSLWFLVKIEVNGAAAESLIKVTVTCNAHKLGQVSHST